MFYKSKICVSLVQLCVIIYCMYFDEVENGCNSLSSCPSHHDMVFKNRGGYVVHRPFKFKREFSSLLSTNQLV